VQKADGRAYNAFCLNRLSLSGAARVGVAALRPLGCGGSARVGVAAPAASGPLADARGVRALPAVGVWLLRPAAQPLGV
jgi:hypothetical protein